MATQILPHTQPARPATAAVLAYLAAGHSNAEAAARFGIHERSVRRIKQRATEQTAPTRATVPVPHAPADEPPPSPAFPPTADDVAGDHTMWRCPATGELMPIVPGTHRQAWERERRETHARHVARVMSPGPDRTPDTVPTSTEPDMSGHEPCSAPQSEMAGPDTRPEAARTGQDRTDLLPEWKEVAAEPRGTRAEPRKGAQPAGMVRDYLKHQAAEVRRDGLLVLAWRWIDEHDMIGPVPVWALLLLAFGVVLVQLGVLG